jgi:oligopeptide transport system substrate-binding protein
MIAIAALIVMMAIACGGGGGKPADQQLRIRIASDVSSFDPQLAISADEISVAKQLYRGLFTYDDKLNVVPSIAAELPAKDNGGISADGLTYTIKLRDDATWSDGQPLVAADFVYAFQRLFDPDAGAQGAYSAFYTAITGAGAASTGEGSTSDVGVAAQDEHTLVFTLDHPQPTLVTLLALWPASPLRQDVIEQHGDSWTEPGTMVTDGPFVLAKYDPGIEIDLQKNPNYWASDGPKLEQIEYHVIPDDDAALLAYKNNEIDMTSIPLAAAPQYEGNKEQVRFGQLETMAVQYNVSKAPFDNKLVRQAFSRAIDRETYVATLLSGIGVPAEGWLPPGMPGVSANIGADLGFDENAAKKLLTDAGYANGKDFPKVTITIPIDDTYQSVAEYVQEELKKNLGIDTEIQSLEANAYGDAWMNGDFQIALFDWFADYADPEDWLPQQFATDGSLNVTHYSNPQVDELLTQASAELDQSKRIRLYEQAHNLIVEDQAVTPLYHPERNYLVKHKVAGLDVTPLDAQPSDWFYEQVRITGSDSAPPASNPDE